MSLTLNVIDVRGIDRMEAIEILKQQIEEIANTGSFWLIDDHEPFDCYDYLVSIDYDFETYIVSKTEYRIFVEGYRG